MNAESGLDFNGRAFHFEYDPIEAAFVGLFHYKKILLVPKGGVDVLITTWRTENQFNEFGGQHLRVANGDVMDVAFDITRLVPDELQASSMNLM